MSPASPHRLLLASAGTGKTWQLTGHYLALLLGGVDPGRLLATTFTRKAAGEILDRVLERLMQAARDPEALADLRRATGRDDLGAEACIDLLAHLTRRLERFRVGTLDAFFVRLGHLFAHDLDLPGDWTIADELDERELEAEAVARVMEAGPEQELVELLRALQREGPSRSVQAAMLRVVRGARAAFLESTPDAWRRPEVPDGLDEGQLQAALARLEALELPKTAKGTLVKTWSSNHRDALRYAARGSWEEFLRTTLVQRVLEGAAFASKPITPDVRAAFEPLITQAAHTLLKELRRRNGATFSLLERYEEALRAVKRERGSYRFEDLPLALVPGGPAAVTRLEERQLDLEFRLDSTLDHLLLDEFQDTAPLQWRTLRPLAEEILHDGSGERTFFCVGDVKQSIYGWRSAEPRLLARMAERYEGWLDVRQLTESYRSSAVVLDTVNRVFERIEDNATLAGDKRAVHREAARSWREGFDTHSAARDLPGSALLLQAPEPDEDEDPWAPVLERVADSVTAIARDAPGATVGILLRRNEQIPWIIDRLARIGIRASGEGGNPLTDSTAVLHLVSLLQLADHPADSLAAFHVETSPLARALPGLLELEPGAHPAVVARAVRRILAGGGCGALCGRLLPVVEGEGGYTDWDARRFRQLADMAFAYDARAPAEAPLRADRFVDMVREKKVENPASSGVKVMTVHMAKGLEFDAVLLPELDEDVTPRGIRLLRLRPDPTLPIEAVSVHPGSKVVALDEDLSRLYTETRAREIEEALCILYVAMTRAKHHLEMIVRHPGWKRVSYAAILRDALGAGEPDGDGVLWRHPDGVRDWFPRPAAQQAAPVDGPVELGLRPSSGPRSLPRRSPSAEEGSDTVRGRELLRRRPDALVRGTLVHRWLEEVEWIEEFHRSDEDLLELGAEIEPDEEQRRAALAEFRAAVARPTVRGALSMVGRAGDLFSGPKVWRERAFSIVLPGADGGDELWSGSFDRVVLEYGGSDLVGAELIDFKTDSVVGPELEERVAFYRPQLEGYRRALAHITGLLEGRIRPSLLFVVPGERVDL